MKKVIHAEKAPPAIGPYNHATEANGTIYLSGQIALDPLSGNLKTDSIKEETDQVLKNIGAVLSAIDLDYSSILKCSIFINNIENYEAVNEVYSEYFPDDTAPARELIEVSDLPKHVNIEISAIASR